MISSRLAFIGPISLLVVGVVIILLMSATVLAKDTRQELAELLVSHMEATSHSRDDSQQYIEGLRRLAKKNVKEAQYLLGIEMFSGKISAAEAAQLFTLADRNGCAGAGGILGVLYLDGRGVKKNEMLGILWIQSAARRGDAGAQLAIGLFYRLGEYGFKKDIVESYSWSYQALKASNPRRAGPLFLSLQGDEKKLSVSQIQKAKNAAQKRLDETGGVKHGICMHSNPLFL